MNKIETAMKQGAEELKTAHADLLAGRVSALYVDKLYETNQKDLLAAVVAEVKKLPQIQLTTDDKEIGEFLHSVDFDDLETLINNSTGV